MSQTIKPGYKQTEVGVIPNDWEVKRIEELSDFITSGSRGWASFYAETGALFIRSQNVRDGMLSFEDTQYVRPPSGAEGNRTKVNRNDLLITITGNSVGNVALVEQEVTEAYISQHVGLVRLSKPDSGRYISRFLSPNSPGNKQIAGNQSGQSKPGLNLQNLRDFSIALPPTEAEQRTIATALSEMDALLAALDRLIAKQRDLKQAAMQQLLTGQTRLPGFTGKWETKRLGEVLKVRHGKSQHGITAADGKYPILASGGEIGRTNSYLYDRPSVLIGRKGTIDSPQYVDSPFWTVDTLFFT
jgi:type I restriction enzyme S subunit